MNHTVAIMQPYLFPYLGYFNLVAASDYFVFYDDVNFIKKGWIHRNRILVNGQEHLFTVPLKKSSQNISINQIVINDYIQFRADFIKKITLAYKKAPYFNQGVDYIEAVLSDNLSTINQLAIKSIIELCNRLKIKTKFLQSSLSFAQTMGAGRVERLVSISHALCAKRYINAAGGKELYHKEEFAQSGLELKFLVPRLNEYEQNSTRNFIPGLSIIDVVMNVPLSGITNMINSYSLE